MGWMKYFRCLIVCTSCKTVDERAVKKRNKLRKAIGKDEVVPIGGPTFEVEIERAPENDVVIVGQGDDYTMDGKWAAPRSASQASCRSDDGAAPSKSSSRSSLVRFAIDYVKNIVLPEAIERFQRERNNKVVPLSTSSSVSDVSEAASDMVYRAISTASYQVALEKMEVTDLEDTSGNALVEDGYYDEI